MREVVLVIPIETGKQQMASQRLHVSLSDVFGGYRSHVCEGTWKAPTGERFNEQCRETKIAVRDEGEAASAITLLKAYGTWAGEQAIYYVDFEGEAHVESL
jgi:hypothetical protein